MSWKNLALPLAAATLMLSSITASTTEVVRMPKALRGMWDQGPTACKLHLSPDSQSPIWIEGANLRGYERKDVPIKVNRLLREPAVWVIVSVDSDLAPDISSTDIFVLKGDTLTITDGRLSSDYRRCK